MNKIQLELKFNNIKFLIKIINILVYLIMFIFFITQLIFVNPNNIKQLCLFYFKISLFFGIFVFIINFIIFIIYEYKLFKIEKRIKNEKI